MLSFQNSALQIEHLLDSLAVGCGDDDLKIIETLYQRAMDLEVAFFDAQPVCESSPLRAPLFKPRSTGVGAEQLLTVVSDFDSTCTLFDSCPVLANLTVSAAERAETEGAGKLATDLRGKWNTLTELYVEDYSKLLEEVLASRHGGWLYDSRFSSADEVHIAFNSPLVEICSQALSGSTITRPSDLLLVPWLTLR